MLDYLLNRSQKTLGGVNPYVASKAIELIKNAHQDGIYIAVVQGLRTFEEQNRLYAQGRTKPGQIVTYARGGQSIHNYGLAFDIAVFDSNRNPIWSGWQYDRVGVLGESLGLEWGGRWTRPVDKPHFQWTSGLTLRDLQKGKRPNTPKINNIEMEMDKLAKDINKLADWAQESAKWATTIGLSDMQRPAANAERQEVVTMFKRYYEITNKQMMQSFAEIKGRMDRLEKQVAELKR